MTDKAKSSSGDDAAFEVPRAVVTRILKGKFPDNVQVSKDARAAMSKAAGVFILYLTACANDICRNNKRSILGSNDVLSALDDMEFGHFKDTLEACVAAHKAKVAAKKHGKTVHSAETHALGDSIVQAAARVGARQAGNSSSNPTVTTSNSTTTTNTTTTTGVKAAAGTEEEAVLDDDDELMNDDYEDADGDDDAVSSDDNEDNTTTGTSKVAAEKPKALAADTPATAAVTTAAGPATTVSRGEASESTPVPAATAAGTA